MVMVRMGEVERCFTVFSHIVPPPSTFTLTPHLCHCLLIPGEDGPQVNQLTRHVNSSRAIAHTSLSTWTWVPYPTSVTSEPVGRGGERRGGRGGDC